MKRIIVGIIMLFIWGSIDAQTRLEIDVDAPDGDDRIMSILTNTAESTLSAAIMQLKAGTGVYETTTQFVTFHPLYTGTPNTAGFAAVTNSGNGVLLNASEITGKHRFFVGGTSLSNNRMTIANSGIGVGTDVPKTGMHISNVSFYLDNSSTPILQAADGSCWQLEVSSTGSLSTTSITCP